MAGALILTHGLPGSGKSTWAQKQVDQNPTNTMRVNRDDIRTELFGFKYHSGNFPRKSEAQVTRVQHERIKEGLRKGKIVICDDTNLNPRFMGTLVKIGHDYDAQVMSRYFDVSPEECKRRNVKRDRVVPDEVIDRMWNNAKNHDGTQLRRFVIGKNGNVGYARDESRPDEKRIIHYNASRPRLPKNNGDEKQHAICFDMDGTLADTRAISDKWMGNNQRNFHRFHMDSEFVEPNEDVLAIAKQCHENNLSVIIITARMADYSKPTINWLEKNGVPVERLYMRASGDYRPDYEVKTDIIKQIGDDGYDIVHAVDDNPQVLRRWMELGIMVTRVPWHTPVDLADGQEPPKYEKQVIPSPINSGYCLRCGKPLKKGNIGPKCRNK